MALNALNKKVGLWLKGSPLGLPQAFRIAPLSYLHADSLQQTLLLELSPKPRMPPQQREPEAATAQKLDPSCVLEAEHAVL